MILAIETISLFVSFCVSEDELMCLEGSECVNLDSDRWLLGWWSYATYSLCGAVGSQVTL